MKPTISTKEMSNMNNFDIILTVISGVALCGVGCWEIYKSKRNKRLDKLTESHWNDYFDHKGLYPYQIKGDE